jgi:hypothetical protein
MGSLRPMKASRILVCQPARSGSPWLAGAALAFVLSGCTAVLPGPISIGTLPSVGPLPAPDSTLADNAPTVVYAAIAQKALVCWMGPKGPFKATHIFHADAASPTTGGQAEIVLHERDLTQKHPWGPRTFRIALSPEGGDTNTRVEMQNIKMKRDMADALRTDVVAWARGKDSCQAQVVQPPPPEPVAAPTKVKKKTKAG